MATSSRKWISPVKVREYYLDRVFDHLRSAQYALFYGVVEGRVRCRLDGKLLDAVSARALGRQNWGGMYELPSDIEISVDDVVEEFERGHSRQRAPEAAALPKWFEKIFKRRAHSAPSEPGTRAPGLSSAEAAALIRKAIDDAGGFISQHEGAAIVRARDPNFKRDSARLLTKQLTANTKPGPRGPRKKRAK